MTGFYLLMFISFCVMQSGDVSIVHSTNTFYSVKGNNTYRRFHEFSADSLYDIIIYGSSHAYRGYDPGNFENIGMGCYNLGSSGQSIRETCLLIEHYPILPGLLIIDIYPGAFKTDGIESASNLISNVPDDNLARNIAFENYDWRLFNCYFKRQIEQNNAPVYLEDSSETINYYHGYVGCDLNIQQDFDYTAIGKEFKPADESFEYFDRLVNYLVAQKANAVFVTHPLPHLIDHTEMTTFATMVDSVLDNRIPFLDYSFRLSQEFNPKSDFYDHHHLNRSGVQKFNAQLIRDLDNRKCLHSE